MSHDNNTGMNILPSTGKYRSTRSLADAPAGRPFRAVGWHAMNFILALDQGTTSSRAIVFDAAGAIRAVAQKEFAQHFPRPGWVEHDPEEIWATQFAVAGEAIARAGIHAGDVAAIGITNQRETTVVWDRASGRPVYNAIVWQDRRTAAACDALKARGLEERVAGKTGLVLDAYFSGTKLAWILDNVPGARAPGGGGRAAVRHRGHLACLEALGRRGARHRSEQCLAHAALQHPHRILGRRTAAVAEHPAQRAAGGARHRAASSPKRRLPSSPRAYPSPASPGTSRRRCSASAASRPAWSRIPTAPAASC